MSDFLKEQAHLLQRRQKIEDNNIMLHLNKSAYPYTFLVQKDTKI